MQRAPTESTGSDAANLHFREQHVEEVASQRDDTTVAFDGLMKVTADEAGGDPYNRTGSFRRLVR